MPAAYRVTASAPGLVSDAMPIDITASPATLDITLHISAVAETLVVSAAQIDQPLSRIPDSVTVIPGAEIEAKQQFMLGVGAAIGARPDVQQNGGPGTVTSLFTRGGESDFTLVMIDGIRANAFGGGLDLSQVPLQDVERIEVVRGPQSALYGSDAIAGVINVITRSGGSPSAQAHIETGSRDMLRASGATTGEKNGVRWQLGANYFEDAGFTGPAANGQTVSNDDAQEMQTSGSIGWRHATAGSDLQGSIQYLDTERGSPGPYGSDPADRYAGVDTISRGTTKRDRRRRAIHAAMVRRVEPRPAAHRVRRHGLRSQLHEPVRRLGRQHPSLARARADRCVRECGVRILRRLRVARRARRQHLHHFGSNVGADADRAGRARHLRRGPLERHRSRHRDRRHSRRAHHARGACPAIRSPSSRGRTSPKRRSTR